VCTSDENENLLQIIANQKVDSTKLKPLFKHTVILPDSTIKETALSSFAFQHCQ
jgi:hypothetical protein